MAPSSRSSGSHRPLTLPEEFVLECHAGSPYGVPPKDEYEKAVRAACLLELGLAGRVAAGPRPSWIKRRLIGSTTPLRVCNATLTADSVLNAVLDELAAKRESMDRWLSDAYRQRLIRRELLAASGKSGVLRVAQYELVDAESVARTHGRLRAALEGEEFDRRTMALIVALDHPYWPKPLYNAAAAIYGQINPDPALKGRARNMKQYETFKALSKLPEVYRRHVEADTPGPERESALAMCDVIDAVAETRSEPEAGGGG